MKKKGLIITLCVFFSIICLLLIYYYGVEDKNTSLTVSQKKWIERNKNKVIDFAVFDEVPIINNNGAGIVFDFLDSLEKDTGLEFNKLSYSNNSDYNSEYSIKVSSDSKNNILFYEDNYVIVTKKKLFFNNVFEISNLKLGILKDDMDKAHNYLSGSVGVSYIPFDDEKLLVNSVSEGSVDGIIVPKLDYLDFILENNYHIAYNIFEYKKNYVLTLGKDKKLNNILVKYFNNYKKKKYEKSISKYLADSYFKLNRIDEKEQTNFISRRYSYGFVYKPPYEVSVNGSLGGIDYYVVDKFSELTNVEVDFKRYSSISNMVEDFNENKLDFISSDINTSKFNMDVYKTNAAYDDKALVVSKGKSDIIINNVSSLVGENVLCVKNSAIAHYLKKNNIKVEEYDNINSVINNLNGENVAAVDERVYDYFVRQNHSLNKSGIINYDSDYGFICRDISSNRIFNNFFDFYLSFYNINLFVNNGYSDIITAKNDVIVLQYILVLLIVLLAFISLFFIYSFMRKRKKFGFKLSKADKIRYIDSLTSLKNRKYLNDNISRWDSSNVYPQAIIIVDLNNIAYINDNFGHAEGDKVIALGGGILINNQLDGSEIVRTNGNEFLIYTIGHDEKTIITYIRKLNKEFKELAHGFGAAIGYSMINDEIKTIDDAINEATIDMRNNKEEVN